MLCHFVEFQPNFNFILLLFFDFSCWHLNLTYRSLLCGEAFQPVNLSFASPSKSTGASAGVVTKPMISDAPNTSSLVTSTPIKLPESPVRNHSASVASSWPGARSASPVASSMMSSSPGSSAGVTPDNATEAKRARSGSLIDSVAHSARMVIEVCFCHTRRSFVLFEPWTDVVSATNSPYIAK